MRFTLWYLDMPTHREVPCVVHPYAMFMCYPPNDDMIPLSTTNIM